MEKKKKIIPLIESNNELIRELTQVEWLKQPWIYTLICGDFSMMQTNIMIQLVRQLQEKFNSYLEKRKKHPGEQLSLFSEEDTKTGVIPFVLELSSICPRTDAYDELEEACESMSKMNMSYSILKNGILTKIYTSPFSSIEITRRVGEYKYKGKAQNGRREGTVVIKMLSENAENMFDMQQGYVNYIASITSLCRRKHTPRLYIYLQRWKMRGSILVKYIELKEYLGVIQRDKKGTEIIKDKYEKYSRFRSDLLNLVKDDMESLAKEGKIDIYFDYKPIYKNGRKRGDPDGILFEIIRSEMGKNKQLKTATFKENIDIQDYMKSEFNISYSDMQSLLESVSKDMLTGFKKEVYSLREKVDKYKPASDKVSGYVMTILRRYIESHTPTAVEVGKEELVQKSPTLEEIKMEINNEDIQNWELFLEMIRKEVSENDYKTWFENIYLLSGDNNTITIKVPNRAFYEMLTDKYGDIIKKSLAEAFGEAKEIYYNIE